MHFFDILKRLINKTTKNHDENV